ncbi:MAG: ABC transporter substrate-binding protein [Vicinamibacterales bacterium]|nr:ABC transporter substrate-binding protein [Vicinamibacterales bacterium]
MTRARVGRALTLAAALAAAAACAGAPATDPAYITVAVPSSPNSFDPRVGTDEVSQRVYQLVYDNLFNLDDRLRVSPGLATGWETPDDRTYVVHLRDGVTFHDGQAFDADDVVYTFGSLIDPEFLSARKGAYRMLERVEALDARTVRFTLSEPFGSFPINLVLPIVPDGAGAGLRDTPVGTGPYRFVRYAVDDRLELARFDGYWQGAARNAGLVLKVVPDDIMRGLELRKGTVDLVINDLAPDIVFQLEEDDALQVVHSPGTDYAYVGFNLRDPLLADVRVRQAIGYAIDRDAIVAHLRRGLARPAAGILPDISWAFEPAVFQFTYDPARARQLLDEAGYPDPDGDGPAPRLHLTLKVSTNEFIRLQAAVIQQDLRAVGIELDVRSYEFATLYADVLRGQFQLFTLQWVGVSDPDMLRRVFHSSQMPPTGFNRGHYRNPEVDQLIDRATVATDDATRREAYGAAQRLIAEEAPYISLWYKTNVAVAQPGIEGLRLSPSADFSALRHVSRAR